MAPFKIISLIILLNCILASCAGKDQGFIDRNKISENSLKLDEALIKRYGADKYGMKPYVMAFLKRGPNRDQDSVEAERLQRAHLDNIGRLAKMGKLVVAGPFMDDTDLRGIYIFNVETVEEAKKLTETDPAIKAGRLIMELHPWYGPAGFMGLDSIQKKITKEEI